MSNPESPEVRFSEWDSSHAAVAVVKSGRPGGSAIENRKPKTSRCSTSDRMSAIARLAEPFRIGDAQAALGATYNLASAYLHRLERQGIIHSVKVNGVRLYSKTKKFGHVGAAESAAIAAANARIPELEAARQAASIED